MVFVDTFFLDGGGLDLFLPQRMSLSLGADVKVVCIPAFVRERLSACEISGMYWMHANDFVSLSSVSFSSPKGRMRKRFLVCVSRDSGFLDLFFFSPFLLLLVVCVGGTYESAIFFNFALSWPLSSYTLRVKSISFFVLVGDEHRRVARQISPLNEAM